MTSLRTLSAADLALARPPPISDVAMAQRAPAALSAPAEELASDPFAFGNFMWLNGTSPQHKNLLDSPIFTGEVIIDVNYALSNLMGCPPGHQHRWRRLHVACRLQYHQHQCEAPTSVQGCLALDGLAVDGGPLRKQHSSTTTVDTGDAGSGDAAGATSE